MMQTIQIGKRQVGMGAACFVIAEAGSNHNGSLEQALRLVELASQAGADAVKFQLFRAEKLYPKSAGKSDYLKDSRSIYDIIRQMEMPYEWLPRLSDRCKELEILFLVSVFDEESADRCDPYVSAHKIASYEMTHFPLVQHVAGKGKPVIISTGTAQLDEVSELVEIFRKTGNPQLLLMQCTAAYPAPLETLNIRALETLRSTFQVPAGLSDHSRHPWLAPVTAAALGADLIEKHFTFSNALPGPDHRFAVEPDELREMVRLVHLAETALGSGAKQMHPAEKELHDFGRRSVFTSQAVRAGEVLQASHLIVLRNGKHLPGAPPGALPSMIGKKALRDLRPKESVSLGDLR